MKALIVEDEIYNFEGLRKMILRAYPQAEIDGPVANLVDLERAMLNQQRYDVVYCDIRLEDGVCFSVFESMDVITPVIFTTAYSEFALKAFAANGIAYLLKPVKPNELKKATDKALSMGGGRQDIAAMLESMGLKGHAAHLHYLKARAVDGSYIIDVGNVSHFTLEDNGTYAMMRSGEKHKIDYSLDTLMQKLDPMMFFRANRQCVVSRNAIHRIRTWDNRRLVIKLADYPSELISVSKENAAALDRWIEQ